MFKKTIQLSIISVLFLLTSCNESKKTTSPKVAKEHKIMKKDTTKLTTELTEMLEALNRHVLYGGDPDHPIQGVISKGESTSKFTELKHRILEQGYSLLWNKNEGKYTLKKN